MCNIAETLTRSFIRLMIFIVRICTNVKQGEKIGYGEGWSSPVLYLNLANHSHWLCGWEICACKMIDRWVFYIVDLNIFKLSVTSRKYSSFRFVSMSMSNSIFWKFLWLFFWFCLFFLLQFLWSWDRCPLQSYIMVSIILFSLCSEYMPESSQ